VAVVVNLLFLGCHVISLLHTPPVLAGMKTLVIPVLFLVFLLLLFLFKYVVVTVVLIFTAETAVELVVELAQALLAGDRRCGMLLSARGFGRALGRANGDRRR
jgi:hypothetical protein